MSHRLRHHGEVTIEFRRPPSNPIESIRHELASAQACSRNAYETANANLAAIEQKLSEKDARIKALETTLVTVKRLVPNDGGVESIINNALNAQQ